MSISNHILSIIGRYYPYLNLNPNLKKKYENKYDIYIQSVFIPSCSGGSTSGPGATPSCNCREGSTPRYNTTVSCGDGWFYRKLCTCWKNDGWSKSLQLNFRLTSHEFTCIKFFFNLKYLIEPVWMVSVHWQTSGQIQIPRHSLGKLWRSHESIYMRLKSKKTMLPATKV